MPLLIMFMVVLVFLLEPINGYISRLEDRLSKTTILCLCPKCKCYTVIKKGTPYKIIEWGESSPEWRIYTGQCEYCGGAVRRKILMGYYD